METRWDHLGPYWHMCVQAIICMTCITKEDLIIRGGGVSRPPLHTLWSNHLGDARGAARIDPSTRPFTTCRLAVQCSKLREQRAVPKTKRSTPKFQKRPLLGSRCAKSVKSRCRFPQNRSSEVTFFRMQPCPAFLQSSTCLWEPRMITWQSRRATCRALLKLILWGLLQFVPTRWPWPFRCAGCSRSSKVPWLAPNPSYVAHVQPACASIICLL